MAAIREKTFDEAENICDDRVDAEVLDKGVPRLPVTAMIANKGAVNTVRHTLAAAGVSPAGITSGTVSYTHLVWMIMSTMMPFSASGAKRAAETPGRSGTPHTVTRA